jgi:hypothetical protein
MSVQDILQTEALPVGLRTPDRYYNPYASPSTPWKEGVASQRDSDVPSHFVVPAQPKPSRNECFVNVYGAISWTLGFREKYSLLFFVLFGGALIGFCLARTMMMYPANIQHKTVPGEWFWYRQRLYKPCILIHVYLSIISGIFAVFQFIPAIRRRAVILHRINGYMVLMLLIPSTVGGSIVARRAFGGDLNIQSSFFTLCIMIVSSAAFGILNVRQTRKHRKWMLRTVTYAAVPITARLATISARYVTSHIGSYYAIWRCDEILFVLKNMDAVNDLPLECLVADDLASVHTVVRAAVKHPGLGFASSVRATFGMSLWLAIVIHTIGVELYIRQTERANQFRRGFVLERIDMDDDGDMNKRTPDDS